MKIAKIIIHKNEVDHDIDAGTFKRVDATLDQNSQRSQNAVASDSVEDLDGSLIARFRDRRDARLRSRLRFCLVEPENAPLVFCNVPNSDETYIYELRVPDTFTSNELQSIGTRIHEYLVRGSLRDWYLGAGLQPSDSEDMLEELEDSISAGLRGKSYGHRPMQPFGPAFYFYNDEEREEWKRM